MTSTLSPQPLPETRPSQRNGSGSAQSQTVESFPERTTNQNGNENDSDENKDPPRKCFIPTDIIIFLVTLIFEGIAIYFENDRFTKTEPFFGQKTNKPFQRKSTIPMEAVYGSIMGFTLWVCVLDIFSLFPRYITVLKCCFNICLTALVTFVTHCSFTLIKALSSEKRPNFDENPEKIDRFNSFPSGHACLAFFIPFSFIYISHFGIRKGVYHRKWMRVSIVFFVLCQFIFGVIVCYSRIFDHKHFWHDIVFGVILSLIIMYLLFPFLIKQTMYSYKVIYFMFDGPQDKFTPSPVLRCDLFAKNCGFFRALFMCLYSKKGVIDRSSESIQSVPSPQTPTNQSVNRQGDPKKENGNKNGVPRTFDHDPIPSQSCVMTDLFAGVDLNDIPWKHVYSKDDHLEKFEHKDIIEERSHWKRFFKKWWRHKTCTRVISDRIIKWFPKLGPTEDEIECVRNFEMVVEKKRRIEKINRFNEKKERKFRQKSNSSRVAPRQQSASNTHKKPTPIRNHSPNDLEMGESSYHE